MATKSIVNHKNVVMKFENYASETRLVSECMRSYFDMSFAIIYSFATHQIR